MGIVIGLGLCVSTVSAETKPKIVELMKATGFEQSLSTIPRQCSGLLASSLVVDPKLIPEAKQKQMLEDLAAIGQTNFDKVPFRANMIAAFTSRYDETKITAILTYIKSPEASRLLNLEKTRTAPELFKKEFPAFAAKLKKTPPPKDRVAFFAGIADKKGQAEVQADLASTLQQATVTQISAKFAGADKPGSAEIAKAVQNERKLFLAMNTRQEVLNMLYLFDGIPLNTVKGYFKFYNSPAFKWYRDTMAAGYHKSFLTLADLVAVDFVKFYTKEEATIKAARPKAKPADTADTPPFPAPK